MQKPKLIFVGVSIRTIPPLLEPELGYQSNDLDIVAE
jgi:hypothetical protein